MNRRHVDVAPDWGKLLDDLQAVMPLRKIAEAMGLTMITESMLRSYRGGVQPMFWRGDALVTLWCDTMKVERENVPRIPVVRGHRTQRRLVDTSPRVMALPNWPTVASPASNGVIGKRKRQKVAA